MFDLFVQNTLELWVNQNLLAVQFCFGIQFVVFVLDFGELVTKVLDFFNNTFLFFSCFGFLFILLSPDF